MLGGSIGAASMAKRQRICELARQEGVPLLFLLDGAGHRLTERGYGLITIAVADVEADVGAVLDRLAGVVSPG